MELNFNSYSNKCYNVDQLFVQLQNFDVARLKNASNKTELKILKNDVDALAQRIISESDSLSHHKCISVKLKIELINQTYAEKINQIKSSKKLLHVEEPFSIEPKDEEISVEQKPRQTILEISVRRSGKSSVGFFRFNDKTTCKDFDEHVRSVLKLSLDESVMLGNKDLRSLDNVTIEDYLNRRTYGEMHIVKCKPLTFEPFRFENPFLVFLGQDVENRVVDFVEYDDNMTCQAFAEKMLQKLGLNSADATVKFCENLRSIEFEFNNETIGNFIKRKQLRKQLIVEWKHTNPSEILKKVLLGKGAHGISGFDEIKHELKSMQEIIFQCPDQELFFGASQIKLAIDAMEDIFSKEDRNEKFTSVDLLKTVRALMMLRDGEALFEVFADDASQVQTVNFRSAGKQNSMLLSEWKNLYFKEYLKKIDHKIETIIQASDFSFAVKGVQDALKTKDNNGRTYIDVGVANFERIKKVILDSCGSDIKGLELLNSSMSDAAKLSLKIGAGDLKQISIKDVFQLISKLEEIKSLEEKFVSEVVEQNPGRRIKCKVAASPTEVIIADLSMKEWQERIINPALKGEGQRIARLTAALERV